MRRPGVLEVFYLFLAVATAKTGLAKGQVAGQDGEIFDFIFTDFARIGAAVTDERAIAKEQEICFGIEGLLAFAALEAVDVPSVTGCKSKREEKSVSEAVVSDDNVDGSNRPSRSM